MGRIVAAGRTLCAGIAALAATACSEPYVAGAVFTMNDNGAWSWFMDERVVVHDGKLVVGSVRSEGDFEPTRSMTNWGNVEVSTYDLETEQVGERVLFRRFEQDDHASPSFLPLKDGGLLALFTKHRQNQNIYVVRAPAGDPLRWSDPDVVRSPKSRLGDDYATYSNLFRLPSGRIVNFYRGYHQDPNYMVSDDEGVSWTYGGRMMQGQDGYSPYLKYSQDSAGRIHFVATEDHPATFDNSLYHGVLDGQELRRSDGTLVTILTDDTSVAAHTWEFTLVFQGDRNNVAWMNDLEIDEDDHPVISFSIQKNRDMHDLRYGYARWDGQSWHSREIAYAGERLYDAEADYPGLATIDPQDTRVLYVSSNADLVDGSPMISSTDGLRHWELSRGVTVDGEAWEWSPITRDSVEDNLRPLVPHWDDSRTALVWMRGAYISNRGNWTTAVVGMVLSD